MPAWPTTLLALLIGIAGWYYLFYSRAAHRLAGVEAAPANGRRVRLRRANGAAMIVLAVLLYVGTHTADPERHPRTFLGVWMGVILMLFVVVALGLADVRLTVALRAAQRKGRDG